LEQLWSQDDEEALSWECPPRMSWLWPAAVSILC
jgi:hypothetical protein